jgi:hypothetical protein
LASFDNLASSLARIFSSSRALTLARWLTYAAPSWGKNDDLSTPMYEAAARTCTYFNDLKVRRREARSLDYSSG